MRTESSTNTTLSTAMYLDATPEVEGASNAGQGAAVALSAALSGNPELLLGEIMSRMRDSQFTSQAHEVRAETFQADNAERSRQEAIQKAQEAAKQASTFLGIGGIFGKIASIAATVASVAAAIASGGAALVLAGAAIMACGKPITDALVKAGVLSPEIATAVCVGLEITGAIMMGGAGSAGTVASAESALAETANGVAGAARLVSLTARGARVLTDVARAVESRKADLSRADAESQKEVGESARTRVEDAVENARASQQVFARSIAALRQTEEARGEALRAATRMRG